MLPLILGSEPLTVKNIKVLIYGDPGVGKTSLAFSTKNPILLDFDGGAQRSAFRKDILRITDWQTIQKQERDFYKLLGNYDTIILDTVDAMLDQFGTYIKLTKPKLKGNKLQFYGELKDMFADFINILLTLDKDVIMIAHVTEQDGIDQRQKVPQITGGSKDRVFRMCDYIGYMYTGDRRARVLDFNPRWDFWAKNSSDMLGIEIPTLSNDPQFFEGIIKEMKSALGNISTGHQEVLQKLQEVEDKLDKITTVDAMNKYLKSLGTIKNGKAAIWEKMKERASELNLEWNAKDKKFIDIEQPQEDLELQQEENEEVGGDY